MSEQEGHFRQTRRPRLALPVRFRRDRTDAALEHAGVTRDLGIGGAFIETDSHLPVGERVRVVVTAPSAWDPLELRAQVRWVEDGERGDPQGIGVAFDTLSGDDATALYDLIHASEFGDRE